MVNENAPRHDAPLPEALAVYKNKPALVTEKTQDKIVIALPGGEKIKVREKDIEIIHPGPVKNFSVIGSGAAESAATENAAAARETWELLLADEGEVTLKELAELVFGEFSPSSAWAAYCLLTDGLYFTGTASCISPRQRDFVDAEEKKRGEKQRASGERELFLERLRSRKPILAAEDDAPNGGRFIQDIEALALGKSEKSRTMKDIGMGETPEEAHALLLECGFWAKNDNPHPARCGVSLLPAQHIPHPPPEEKRRDLTYLPAFAIDSPWSHDPDDAVSIELENGRQTLYVHVADPAASIDKDNPCETEARGRGATLYIPEGSIRMLADECLPLFALGLAETSPALTFKVSLDSSGEIEATEIFPSTVKVKRLTYQETDEIIADGNSPEAALLRDIDGLAQRNFKRRLASGAIHIEMPETHISLINGQVSIEPIVRYGSADVVRECMLLAGEGAGIWALQHNVPIPYIEQETGDIPAEIPPGMAGDFQLRRCMRPRMLSVKPGLHQGLGMNTYTQVTSPLRRYTDLLAHIQIRAFLKNTGPLSADEVAARMIAGEAAAVAVAQAERASRSHWTAVFLSGKKDSSWEAVALEKKGNRWTLAIPALALETQVPLRNDPAPNDTLTLILKSVNIPKGEAVFVSE